MDPLIRRARAVWEEPAGAAFPAPGAVRVAVAPGSGLCPAGWVGVVVLGGAALATAPDEDAAAAVRALPPDAFRDPRALLAALPAAAVLGPATLAYAVPHTFRPVAAAPLEQLPPGHPDIRRLERAAGPDDAAEAALDEITSPAFVIRRDGEVASAAGYRTWPAATAHLSVLTSPRTRGLGLARTTASAATTHALTAALLPQWRARPSASRRVAAALGFTELGFQLSVELR